jgi:hypothetical protein
LAEHRRAHAVEGVTGARAVHGRAEPADAQHRRRNRSDDRKRPAAAAVLRETVLQRADRVPQADGDGGGRLAHVVAELGEEERELGFRSIGRVHRLLRREGLEELIRPVDFVE